MKKVIFIITFLTIISHCNSQGWIQQSSGTLQTLYSVQFVNEYTGYIAGGAGIILKTTNGGNNWFGLTSNTTNNLKSIYFIDINTGTCVGENSTVRRTVNGGVTWSSQNAAGSQLSAVYFINVSTGFIVSNSYAVFVTTDGGNNWILRPLSGKSYLNDIYFFDANTGLVAGSMPSIGRTTNAGLNWTLINIASSLYSVSFLNVLNTGWAVGGNGTISKSTNRGLNWTSQVSGIPNILYDVSLVDTNSVIVVGQAGAILRTTNGGNNWYSQTSPTNNTLRSVSFINANTGWAAGTFGTIIKTTNGGITSAEIHNSNTPEKFYLYQNYPNPFNPSTKIKFDITARMTNQSSNVKLIIYDILGQEVTILLNEELKPGTYETEWPDSPTNRDGENFACGVYFYELSVESSSEVYHECRKMIYIK